MFVMDSSRNILLSSRSDIPQFLDVPEDVSWGIFDDMDREPHKTALRLAEGWKSGDSTIAIGRSVMEGNRSLKAGRLLATRSNPQDEQPRRMQPSFFSEAMEERVAS